MDTNVGDVTMKYEPNEVNEKSENEGRGFRKYDSEMESEDCDSKIKIEKTAGSSSEPSASEMNPDSNDVRVKKEEGEFSTEKSKNPSAVVHQFKDMYTKCLNENIRLHQIVTSLQESQHTMSLKVCCVCDR